MKNKTIPKDFSFSLNFSTFLKQIKIKKLKTLLKLVAKTLKKMRIFALEKLGENSSRMGYLLSLIHI